MVLHCFCIPAIFMQYQIFTSVYLSDVHCSTLAYKSVRFSVDKLCFIAIVFNVTVLLFGVSVAVTEKCIYFRFSLALVTGP